MRTITTTVYSFSELSKEAQAKAIEKYREETIRFNDVELDYAEEWVTTAAKIIGIEIPEGRLHYSISCSQGDGASFEGRYAYAKGAVKAVRKEFGGEFGDEVAAIASKLQGLQAMASYKLGATISTYGNYSHSGSMAVSVFHASDKAVASDVENELTDLLREFADLAYHHLLESYDHEISDENIGETLECNEYEYDENGNPA